MSAVVNNNAVAPSGVQNSHQLINNTNTTYNASKVSYVVTVIDTLNHLGLAPIEQTMTDEASLMEVTDKIQKCLTKIQSFYQKIEGQAKSGGAYIQYHEGHADFIGPNAYDGLNKDYYYQTLSHFTAHSSESSTDNNLPNQNYYGSEQVSSGFQSDMQSFISNLNQIFECGTIPLSSQGAVPVSALKDFTVEKVDPKTGQYVKVSVDMTSTYSSLNSGAFAPFVKEGLHSFLDPTTSGSTSSSLIMQYVFDKARVTADTLAPGALFNIATKDKQGNYHISDATQIINFDPTQGGGDGVLKTLYNLVNDLNTTVSVSRSSYEFDSFNNEETPSILALIYDNNNGGKSPDLYQGDWDVHNDTAALLSHYNVDKNGVNPNQHMGLYGTFSYLAFNYYWNKNSSASISGDQKDVPIDSDNPYSKDPNYEGNGFWSPEHCEGWAPGWNNPPFGSSRGKYGDLRGKSATDQLDIFVNSTQSSTSLLSSANSESSTAMQEYTSQESQFQNIGQNVIKGNSQNLKVTVKNNNG